MANLIYLIRHGETDFNKQNIVQGSGVDTNLNAQGIWQAEQFYAHYQHIAFDHICISALKRTYQSVQKFIEIDKIPYSIHEGLNEINWGIIEGKRQNENDREQYFKVTNEWSNGNFHSRMFGGESAIELQNRQKNELKNIIEKMAKNNLLICMHGRAMKSFLCLLLNRPLSEMENFKHSNLGLYILAFDKGHFELLDSNNQDHLMKGLDNSKSSY